VDRDLLTAGPANILKTQVLGNAAGRMILFLQAGEAK
jgi:hypothetical protein